VLAGAFALAVLGLALAERVYSPLVPGFLVLLALAVVYGVVSARALGTQRRAPRRPATALSPGHTYRWNQSKEQL
jgi:uncharacterized membrane protein YfcA